MYRDRDGRKWSTICTLVLVVHIGQAYWAKTRVWKEPDLDKVQKVEGWEKKAGHHRKEDTPCSTMANMSVFQR
jgi:hypothetical protein